MSAGALRPTAASLRPALADIAARTRSLAGGLTGDQLLWRPGAGWSVGQVLEHLVLIHEPYVGLMKAALDEGRERARSGSVRPWKPTLLGRFIVRSMTSQRKVKTGRKFDPGPDAGPGAAARFLATVEAMAGMVDEVDGADMRIRFTSPVAAVFRPNLGDAFLLMTVHAQRHLDQIERIRADAAFPGAGP